MTDFGFWPLAVAAGIALSAVAYRRLQTGVQPLRLELAERGERLLSNPDLSDCARQHVEMLLRTAFGMRFVLIVGIVAVPFLVLLILLVPGLIDRIDRVNDERPDLKVELDKLDDLHRRITWSNNPILAFAFDLQLGLFVPLPLLLRFAIEGVVRRSAGRDTIMKLIESKTARHWKAA